MASSSLRNHIDEVLLQEIVFFTKISKDLLCLDLKIRHMNFLRQPFTQSLFLLTSLINRKKTAKKMLNFA